MTTKAFFRKDAVSKKGEASVLIRITVNRLKTYINLGIRINEKYWDTKNSQIKRTHPNYKLLNAKVIKMIAKVQATAMELDIRGKNYTAKTLKEIVENKHDKCIIQFGKAWYEERYNKHEISIGTYSARMACLNKLQEFAKGFLRFDDLDYEHLLKYDSFLITKLGNSRNTANTNLKCVQAIYNEAIRRDIASYDNNPFKKFKFRSNQKMRESLSAKELEAIENIIITEPIKKASRDIFVFCCYTGLRIGEALKLTKEQIDGKTLKIKERKGGGFLVTYMLTKAFNIANQYSAHETDGFLFPFLKESDRINNEKLHKRTKSTTALINKNLKSIALKLEIDKKVSTHIGRHTFAMIGLHSGMKTDQIKGLLGHRSITTTEIYAKVNNQYNKESIKMYDELVSLN